MILILLQTDYNNNVVKRVNSMGVVSVVVGSGTAAGYAGDGGLATAAAVRLNGPSDVAVDPLTPGAFFVVSVGQCLSFGTE